MRERTNHVDVFHVEYRPAADESMLHAQGVVDHMHAAILTYFNDPQESGDYYCEMGEPQTDPNMRGGFTITQIETEATDSEIIDLNEFSTGGYLHALYADVQALRYQAGDLAERLIKARDSDMEAAEEWLFEEAERMDVNHYVDLPYDKDEAEAYEIAEAAGGRGWDAVFALRQQAMFRRMVEAGAQEITLPES